MDQPHATHAATSPSTALSRDHSPRPKGSTSGMASSENSTTNIAEDAIVIAEAVHSTAEFDVNQLTEQTPNASSSGDVSSTSNNSVHSSLEFIGVEHQVFLKLTYYAFHVMNEILELVAQCTYRLRCKTEKLSAFVEQIRVLKNHIFEEYPNEPDYNKKISVIGDMIRQSQSGNILYTAPQEKKKKSDAAVAADPAADLDAADPC
ncbi:hypothetical protein L1987_80705 [Smallanthus sonchifolius]|uniref:Uncharacterized protein n=1 Tax=Smallanthus sonchifolius TaxID=185202 RepID=A0ACB8YPM7_9ASTR|nr:hypothetical protein L1987_80705 [Smallanthus sonchifolius]